MVRDLKTYGIQAFKAETIKWPDLHWQLYRHYLRGLVDGDGSFSICKATNQLCLGVISNWSFSVQLQNFLIDKFGFGETKIDPRPKCPSQYVVRYSGNQQLFPLVNYLYRDTDLYLLRKRDIVHSHYQRMPKYSDRLQFGPNLAE
jgi:hypothetical protein